MDLGVLMFLNTRMTPNQLLVSVCLRMSAACLDSFVHDVSYEVFDREEASGSRLCSLWYLLVAH